MIQKRTAIKFKIVIYKVECSSHYLQLAFNSKDYKFEIKSFKFLQQLISQMKTIIVVAALIALSLSFRFEADTNDINWPFTGCNVDSIKFTNLTLTETPAKNKNITAKLNGTVINAIEVKEVDIGLLFNAGPVNVEYIPWSAKFNAGSVLNYTYKFEIPSFYNSGRYTYVMSFLDPKDNLLGCLKFQFTI